jgi:hypothetical protein
MSRTLMLAWGSSWRDFPVDKVYNVATDWPLGLRYVHDAL